MDLGETTAGWLQTYGPWAVVVLCLIAIAVLWRTLSAERKEHDLQLERIAKEQKTEMAALLDRLVAASNSQIQKFSDLAEQNSRVIEALSRRVRGSPRDTDERER